VWSGEWLWLLFVTYTNVLILCTYTIVSDNSWLSGTIINIVMIGCLLLTLLSNIYWVDSGVPTERYLELKPYQRINHFPGMGEICRKDSLVRNMKK